MSCAAVPRLSFQPPTMRSNNPFIQDIEDAQAVQAAGAASMHSQSTGQSQSSSHTASSQTLQPRNSHSVVTSASSPSSAQAPSTQTQSLSAANLPAEESHPDEPPPPYTPVADEAESTVIPTQGPLILQRPPDDPPASSSASRPPVSSGNGRPMRPPGTNSHSSYSGANSMGGPSSNPHYHRPPPGPPPGQMPPGPHPHSFGGQMPRPPNTPFAYPPGYWCPKCHNTGIKLKNGLSCQDCYARFAGQSARLQYLPAPSRFSNFMSGPAPPGRVVQPGDPSIGGVLCGRCRGRGLVHDFIFEDTCPTCRGIGRLF